MKRLKRLNHEDIARGWEPMDCGCCAYVFRTELVGKLDKSHIRPCPKNPTIWGVNILVMWKMDAQMWIDDWLTRHRNMPDLVATWPELCERFPAPAFLAWVLVVVVPRVYPEQSAALCRATVVAAYKAAMRTLPLYETVRPKYTRPRKTLALVWRWLCRDADVNREAIEVAAHETSSDTIARDVAYAALFMDHNRYVEDDIGRLICHSAVKRAFLRCECIVYKRAQRSARQAARDTEREQQRADLLEGLKSLQPQEVNLG